MVSFPLLKLREKQQKNTYMLTSGAHNARTVIHRDLPIDLLESPYFLLYFDVQKVVFISKDGSANAR